MILTRIFDRFRFAATDVVRRSRFLQLLRDRIDNFGAGGIRQLAQFFERILQVPFRDAFLFEANQERALLCFLRTRFNHPLCANPEAFGAAKSIRISFVVSEKRQVQRCKISLSPKPGQLSFGVTAGRLLNRGDALRDRHFAIEQFTNFAQADHLRCGRTHRPGGAALLRSRRSQTLLPLAD